MTGNGRRVAATIVALGLFAAGALGQLTDPEAKARLAVADQKAKQVALDTINTADRMARTNRAKALQELKAAQANVGVAIGLSNATREAIIRVYQAKINALEGKPANAGVVLDPTARAVRESREAAREKYNAEIRAVQEGIERIQYYQSKGQFKDAEAVVARLKEAYPTNPAVITLTRKGSLGTAVADARQLTDMMNKRVVLALNDVQRSAIPPKGDIEFPADWAEKSKRRLEAQQLKLTPREKSIIESLNKPVTLLTENRPLQEVLQDLSNQMKQEILVDPRSLNDLGIDLQKPTTIQGKGITARIVLRQVLASAGLTFVVKDEAIQVFTVEKARDLLTTRVYYLGDVVRGVGPFGGPQWGPFLNYEQTMANVKVIIDAIQGGIDPLSWKDKGGGPGTITFHFPSMSIVVRASTEVHASLNGQFGTR